MRYSPRRPADAELRAEAARSRQREPALRLSAAVRFVAAKGRDLGQEPHLPALPRGRAYGAEASRSRPRCWNAGARYPCEARPSTRWSLDFVHDQFACGRRFRILNVVDDVTRECLAALPDTSILSAATGHDRLRQRNRVHLERHTVMGEPRSDRMALHRAGEAHAERVLLKFQRAHARRTFERDAVPGLDHAREQDRRLGQRLQSLTPAFFPRVRNPDQLCRSPVATSAPALYVIEKDIPRPSANRSTMLVLIVAPQKGQVYPATIST